VLFSHYFSNQSMTQFSHLSCRGTNLSIPFSYQSVSCIISHSVTTISTSRLSLIYDNQDVDSALETNDNFSEHDQGYTWDIPKSFNYKSVRNTIGLFSERNPYNPTFLKDKRMYFESSTWVYK
jgi:hypothetical protein